MDNQQQQPVQQPIYQPQPAPAAPSGGLLGLDRVSKTFSNIRMIVITLVALAGLITGPIFWIQGSINDEVAKLDAKIEKLEDKVSDNDIRNNKQITHLLISLLKNSGTKSIDLD